MGDETWAYDGVIMHHACEDEVTRHPGSKKLVLGKRVFIPYLYSNQSATVSISIIETASQYSFLIIST